MDAKVLEKLKNEAAEALSSALGNSTQWDKVLSLMKALETLDGMAAEKSPTPPDPRCILCDNGAPPHKVHGMSAKFEAQEEPKSDAPDKQRADSTEPGQYVQFDPPVTESQANAVADALHREKGKTAHHPQCHTVQMAGKDAWPAYTCPHSPEPKNEPCPPGTRPMATLCAWCRRNPSVASFSREGTGSPICAECVWPASRGKPVLGNPPAWATQHEPESQADDHVPQPTRAEAAQMMSDLSGVNSVCRGNSTIPPRQALGEALACLQRADQLLGTKGVPVEDTPSGYTARGHVHDAIRRVRDMHEATK